MVFWCLITCSFRITSHIRSSARFYQRLGSPLLISTGSVCFQPVFWLYGTLSLAFNCIRMIWQAFHYHVRPHKFGREFTIFSFPSTLTNHPNLISHIKKGRLLSVSGYQFLLPFPEQLVGLQEPILNGLSILIGTREVLYWASILELIW